MNSEKCTQCNGKKKIPTTGSAMYWPERFPNEFVDCPKCLNLTRVFEEEQS